MATLEVHDEAGRVQYVELTSDHPVLFGTSSTCDISLSGRGILPVHGRIRCNHGRCRVEASSEAEYVFVNGHKMTSASLNQGDELGVGPCRLFLLRLDDKLGGRPPDRPPRRGGEKQTRVSQEPAHPRFGGSQPAPAPTPASPPTNPSPLSPRSILEEDNWLEVLELADDLAVPANEETTTLPSEGSYRRAGKARSGPKGKGPAHFLLGWLWQWLAALRDERARAPGKERLVSSPLVVGLVVSLGVLVLMGLGLRSIINKNLADQRYNRAIDVMEDGDYRTAIRDFDDFLVSHSDDPRAGKARVLRALANVRQYISVSGGTWLTALDAAREMDEAVASQSEYRDERPELAELVIRIGEELADRARRSADAKVLQEAESAVPLHARIAGEHAQDFFRRSRLPGLLDEARAAVRKARIRGEAILAMDQAIASRSAPGVYTARDALVDQYADLAQDRELYRRMTMANELVQRAVKVDRARRAAARSPRSEPVGPATSLVLRLSGDAPAAAPGADSIAYALADGFAYGIDAETGAPLWQRPVGLDSPYAPLAVPGDPTVLVVDARHDELLRLDARSGQLVWRLSLGEAVESPPLVQGDQLFQVLPSGKLLEIALETGEQVATVNMGMPLSRAPTSDELGRYVYVVARRDCLFVLGRQDLACRGVEYLGHQEGSSPCTPLRIGRFLIVVENDRPKDSRWRVLLVDEEGVKIKPVQQIDVSGWTWATPTASGSTVWATGDRGGLEAFALGDYASTIPLRSLGRIDPDPTVSGPSFGLATSERELWLSAGRSARYTLDPERGQIAAHSSLAFPGPALAPVQLAGRRVIMTCQDSETGAVALLGLDPSSGTLIWQTELGAAWPRELRPSGDGRSVWTVGQNGREVSLGLEQLRSGGFVTLPLIRPGQPQIPSGGVLSVPGTGRDSLVIAAPGSAKVWVQDPASDSGWRPLELPSALAAVPLAWGSDLLIPGIDGRAYLIDPATARSKAEPLVPVFDRDRRGRWRTPVRLDLNTAILADEAGRLRRLCLKKDPVPRLAVEAETLLDKAIIVDPVATSQAVIAVTADRRVRALSTRDLSPLGAWALAAPIAEDPVPAGGRVFVYDTAGGVMALGPEGRLLWSIKLDAAAAGAPLLQDDHLWLADRDGHLHERALADGALRRQLPLGVLPAGGLITLGQTPLVNVARGSVAAIELSDGDQASR
jgi:outer membrane protein assembly factor BamB